MLTTGYVNKTEANNINGEAEVEQTSLLRSQSNADLKSMIVSCIFSRYNVKKGTQTVNISIPDEAENFAILYDRNDIQDEDFNTAGDFMLYNPDTNAKVIMKADGGIIIKASQGVKISKDDSELIDTLSNIVSKLSLTLQKLSLTTVTVASFGTPAPLSTSGDFSTIKTEVEELKAKIDDIKYVAG